MINQPTIILAAFNQEVGEYESHLKDYKKIQWHDYEFWEGNLFGTSVVVSKSGVGKVHAALVTQRLIDVYQPKQLIFTGLAGSLNEKLEIGDIVVSRDLIQHDFIAHPQFPRYTIPRYNRVDTFHIFSADQKLVAKALKYQPTSHKVAEGRILTGDQFLTRTELNAYKHLTEELHGDVVEMEGAAVAQVCTINRLPFVVIRTISDKANEHAHIDFAAFLPKAASNSLGIVKAILA